MRNPIQEYTWGSTTYISGMLGLYSSVLKPQAELWMGAHPKAPSEVRIDGQWISLPEAIEQNPSEILGEAVSKAFLRQLPFLFKILAVERPLSIQVHPNRSQAVMGYNRENRLHIPLTALNRNYRDKNHKPELLCALTPFVALAGFKEPGRFFELFQEIGPRSFLEEVASTGYLSEKGSFKRFLHDWMTMEPNRRKKILSGVVNRRDKMSGNSPIFQWVVNLSREYRGDAGVLAPLFLNLLELAPGEALFLQPGVPHAYLKGAGVEIMANSDNVLRGGLTPKHVDIDDFLQVLDWQADVPEVLHLTPGMGYERSYPAFVEEFRLSRIELKQGEVFESPRDRNIEIVIAVEGEAFVTTSPDGEILRIPQGNSFLVPASVGTYRIEGNTTLYKATVPL